ncbi:MAG: FtsQ-type POTRA domain-containing protein [Chloroflexi bacterium]|nr:FtsQ-type POTRA domain-containing protein [Chloroflexota bacterium]
MPRFRSARPLPGPRPAAVRTRSGRGRRTAADIQEDALRSARGEPSGGLALSWQFLGWVFGRLLALTLLGVASYVVYDSASSDRFQVRAVHVTGTVLLSPSDVEQVAAVVGANVFWIDRRAVIDRLQALPMVRKAEVNSVLPGSVDIRVLERTPAAFWESAGRTYLVDREGLVLRALDEIEPDRQAVACGGQPCDAPSSQAMPRIVEVDGQPLATGGRVDPRTFEASVRLGTLLPRAGIQPTGFEWSRDRGLEVRTEQGWRVRFDSTRDASQQLATLAAVADYLATTRQPAEVIDVRFGARPYVR